MPGRLARFTAWLRRTGHGALRLLPALVIAGAILALLKADPSRRVDYVKALAWPAVIAFGYFALRDLIHERLRNVSRASVGGVDLEFEKAANDELQAEVREVAAAIAPDGDAEGADPLQPPVLGEPSQESIRSQTERFDAVEAAIKAGAKWGYSMASQYADAPEPIIEWDEAGEPSIVGAHGRRRSEPLGGYRRHRGPTGAWIAPRLASQEQVIAGAEEEVRRRERAYFAAKNGPLSPMIGMLPESDQLKAAKERLARVDPSNHLLL
jgi:hypothetical protein